MNYFCRLSALILIAALLVGTSIAQQNSTQTAFGESEAKSASDQKPGLSIAERVAAKQRFLRDMSLVYDYVYANYYMEPDPEKVLDGALSGIMRNLGDPYSAFINPEEAKSYSENLAGEFGGLGIRIDAGVDEESDIVYIKVISPIKNTPAEQMGILSGDLILAVDKTSLAGYSTQEAVKLMRGKPGTKVTLTIKRGANIFSTDIVRAVINNVDLESAVIDNKIQYLKIDSFSQVLPKDFQEAVREINKKPYDTLIVDLRNNPGGSLNAVVEIADAFLTEGVIVGIDGRNETADKVYYSDDAVLIPNDKKIVVLVNKGSASSSEILAGALKDRKRGTIVGSTTFGKGLVQAVNGFESGFISLTIAQYYTPAKNFINGTGIKPDIELEPEQTAADLSITQLNDLQTMVKNDLALRFVEKNRSMSKEHMLSSFRKEIKDKGLNIPDFFLNQSLEIARNRYNNVIETFNLETDSVLRKTVEMIRAGKIK